MTEPTYEETEACKKLAAVFKIDPSRIRIVRDGNTAAFKTQELRIGVGYLGNLREAIRQATGLTLRDVRIEDDGNDQIASVRKVDISATSYEEALRLVREMDARKVNQEVFPRGQLS